MKPIQTGVERLLADPPPLLQGKRVGLLANPASVVCPEAHGRFLPTRLLLENRFPGQLRALFSPQHGFFAEKQANMIPSDDLIDPLLKIPVFSLYGRTRMPTEDMLEPIDILIVDLQDVGTRVYTFVYTMALCMQKARDCGKSLVVLDRPNPVGGNRIEGNCLKAENASFVGMYPIPMRHGLTIGELAILFNHEFGIDCELTVVPMGGWKRSMLFQDTGLPWVPPSPNLPTPTSALVYPGQVLWEGTNVSEGRGTTQPFEVFGAPYLDTVRLEARILKTPLPGVRLRPLAFEPISDKWKNQVCQGFQLHVTDPGAYRPYLTTLTILHGLSALHADTFQWTPPPYEYEFEKLPFDIITGDPAIREAIEKQIALEDLEERWRDDLEAFAEIRKACLLYE
jgi:uncharacterized protein YbbC (DUF1343 family)